MSRAEHLAQENKKYTELGALRKADLCEQGECMRNSCALTTPIIQAITIHIQGLTLEADLR